MMKESRRFIEILEKRGMAVSERREAIRRIEASDIKAHGQDIPFSYIPLFINDEDLAYLQKNIDVLNRILYKMTRMYVENEEYRKVFAFDKVLERLICLDCNYDEMIPIGRDDFFFDTESGDFAFCEFNTDGSGGMSRDAEITKAILDTFPDRDFLERNGMHPFDVIGSIAENLIRTYRSSSIAVENPLFSITDWREEGVMSDFDRFLAAFRQRGIEARFTDIRDLVFDGKNLVDRTDGRVVNGIYRRAVTSVILEHLEDCRGLIEAVEHNAVVLMGHFRTSLVHSKTSSVALHDRRTWAFLDREEIAFIEKHIPQTYRLKKDTISPELLAEILDNKDAWIIKPEDDFGSHGVYSGMDTPEEEWKKLILSQMDKGDIVQRFCPRFDFELLGPEDERPAKYPLMIGAYVSCGKIVGFYSRAGRAGVIDFGHGGICVTTVKVDGSRSS